MNRLILRQRLATSPIARLYRSVRFADAYQLDHRFIDACVNRRVSTILDIGAHHGESTAAYLARTQSEIVAFEPNPTAIAAFRSNIPPTPRVRLESVALSNEAGSAQFQITANDQASSLLTPDGDGAEAWGAPLEVRESVEVNVTTLDDWAGKSLPDSERSLALKIDVQGAEGLVLDGARRTLSERTSVLLAEVQLADVYDGQISLCEMLELVTTSGPLQLAGIAPCALSKDGVALQTDLLFLRREH